MATLSQISADINGFLLSQQARGHQDAFEYVYGEIEPLSFIALLSLVPIDNKTVFYDLGSGTGKNVIACAMVFPIKKSCGIELFAELHDAALQQRHRLIQVPNYQLIARKIHFIQDNFLNANFNDATLIFINSTGYFGETWEALNQRLDQLDQCCTIITTTKPLIAKKFKLNRMTQVQMSWGIVTSYIHRQVT
ncbi:MAG: methyltransferase [Legionellaceae bacterium]|nr:methyltransferase [Legionellaceae bacterium]